MVKDNQNILKAAKDEFNVNAKYVKINRLLQ